MERSPGPLYESACHEPKYSLVNMLRGYRAAERQPGGAPQRWSCIVVDGHDSSKCEVHSAWSFRVHATIRSVAMENHWRSRFNRFNRVSRS